MTILGMRESTVMVESPGDELALGLRLDPGLGSFRSLLVRTPPPLRDKIGPGRPETMKKVEQQQHHGSDRKENLCVCVSKVAHGERLWAKRTIVSRTKSLTRWIPWQKAGRTAWSA